MKPFGLVLAAEYFCLYNIVKTNTLCYNIVMSKTKE